MELGRLQREHEAWVDHNFPDQKEKPHQPLLGLIEEVGELSHAHLKREQGIRADTATLEALAQDAVGDIVIFLASYCNATGLDLKACVEDAWEGVKRRDWVAYPINGVDR